MSTEESSKRGETYSMNRRRLPCAVLGRNPAHVRRFHCGSFGWSFLAQASQGSSLSALALGLRSRANVLAEGMAWRLGQTHKPLLLGARGLFHG